jgi:hypothetical protein
MEEIGTVSQPKGGDLWILVCNFYRCGYSSWNPTREGAEQTLQDHAVLHPHRISVYRHDAPRIQES